MSTQPETNRGIVGKPDAGRATHVGFVVGICAIFVTLILLLYLLKLPLIVAHWSQLLSDGLGHMLWALMHGVRFSAAAAAMLLLPLLVLWYLAAVLPRRPVAVLFTISTGLVGLLVPVIAISDFVYFQESGKHFTYEATVYLGPAAWPMIHGAFEMHPWALSAALIGCFALAAASGWAGRRLIRSRLPVDGKPRPNWLATLPVLAAIMVVCLRGGVGRFNMSIGDAVISANPYINALCLDPIYAVLRTATSPEQLFRFRTEAENIRTVRSLIGLEGDPAQPRYPLFRDSAGTPQGNRMNVVLFVLESWSGKDIGCLGSPVKVTPFFDDLAGQGMLFNRATSTGIRTAEGIFSILCSFPNQPIKPIMSRYSVLQNRWRSLSQILEDAGYINLFIHGRDVDFDHLRNFLYATHFHKVIDRLDFPVSPELANDSWPGADDEAVVRRADAEFAAIRDRPFLGVIYTMNTHPPFSIPDDFPAPLPADSDSNIFLNSLGYTDHALRVFFDLARTRDYYRNTVFILVADHARTRDRFTLASQHHVPLLFFAPDRVPARINSAPVGQIDILPTVLGLLRIKTPHASWGRDLMTVSEGDAFAVSVAGSEVRWRDRQFLLNDGLTEARPMLFDLLADPDCTRDVWDQHPDIGAEMRTRLRAYVSLSQTLLNENRVIPP
ncbi:MAG TPA: sulfatase-like hydrolase/transferase [Phycisphaerae bacterium]|nr:sulfatase-like hydrolase/transferase [Phycisphaerae bacterium]